MAILKCPECEGNVSSEAEYCIHCGYPLRQKTIINGTTYDLSNELNLVLEDRNIEAIKSIRDKTGLGLADGKLVIDYMITNKKVPSIFTFQEKPSNTPHCPTCSSTNIKKITGTSKATSVVLWGIFSQKVKKTYHCNNCGYEW